MARFNTVDLYPFEGFVDRLWGSADRPPGDPVRDAFLRGARPVVALYTDALREIEVAGPRSELLIAVRDAVATGGEVTVDVLRGEPFDGPEWGFVSLPQAVGDLDHLGRRKLALDVVHANVRELASARGWRPDVFEACRQHVISRGYVYQWNSSWKASPDRRHQARATYRLDEPDGFGRVRLEVRRRGEDLTELVSPPAVASCLASRFRKSAATLRWSDSSSVGLTPLVGHGSGRGAVTARLDGGSWTAVVRDDVTPRRPGAGIAEDPSAPVPAVVAELG